MTADIVSIEAARARRLAKPPQLRPVPAKGGVQAAYAMLADGEVGAHEFLELCQEALALVEG